MADTDTLVATTKPKTEAEKAFAKIEKPESVKDYFVDFLRKAADKVDQHYNGTIDQRDELTDLLRDQADYCRDNSDDAFFPDSTNKNFETGLEKGALDIVNKYKGHLIEARLPKIHNFPTDPKVAGEFTAIVTSSLNDAVEARAIALDKVPVKSPVAATQVTETVRTQEKIATVGN